MSDDSTQCSETIIDDETGEERRCQRPAEEGSDYCWQHPLGTGPTSIPTDKIIAMIHRCRGAVYIAADQLGCSPDLIINRAERDEEVAEAIRLERGKIDDKARLKQLKAIENGEAWAIRARLQQMRERANRLEEKLGIAEDDGDGDGTEINVFLPDSSDDDDGDGGGSS